MNNAYSRQLSSLPIKEKLLQQFEQEPPPFRSELFDAEQMIQYCKQLAGRHKLMAGHDNKVMFRRLLENKGKLDDIHKVLMAADSTDYHVENHEWRTNFYVIENQVSKAQTLLTAVNKHLPRLQGESSKDFPRVYRIITAFISHSNSQVDINNLVAFINAYQGVSDLQIGELKAIQLVLKLALIENLTRIATRLAVAKINQELADNWAGRIITAVANGINDLNKVWVELLQSGHAYKDVVIAGLIKRLQQKKTGMNIPLSRLEQILSEKSLSGTAVIQLVNEELTTEKVSFRNCLSSIRMLDTIDWHAFVDAISAVDLILCREDSGIYALMDYHTRDRYRKELGVIARQAGCSEIEVAEKAVLFANDTTGESGRSHVGYFLIGAGRKELALSLGINLLAGRKFRQQSARIRVLYYLGGFALLTAVLSVFLINKLPFADTNTALWILMLGVIVLSAGQLTKLIVDLVAGFFIEPVLLPRLDFTKGIPAGSNTLVVVPALLSDVKDIDELVHVLEVRFLANRMKHLYFGLLTDFSDAPQETLPGDDKILAYLTQKIAALNHTYGDGQEQPFFLFHRPRKWNPREKKWMGYERKRGKLLDLNALLRNQGDDKFSLVTGDASLFAGIKYVITLDADTQLPRETAWKMVGTMAHPLNHPVYSEKKKRVVSGYGMLQPRMGNDLREVNHSWYHRLTGSGPDLDPYTRATPDLYQDLFGEGSFVGKGIYDVDIFLKVLHNRFPENRVLSHDLLEGCYLRSGLLNDVKLYEHGASYHVEIKRRHRWIRGDWQIAAWIGFFVPAFGKKIVRNPLSGLSRWKIFDNLRGSLSPVSNMLLLLLGMTILPDPLFWLTFGLLVILAPVLILLPIKLLAKPGKLLQWKYWAACVKDTSNHFILRMYDLISLPFEACFTVDAIGRAVWRMTVTKRKLLEWVPSANFKSKRKGSIAEAYQGMFAGPVVSLVIVIWLVLFHPMILLWSSPLLILWMASPLVTWWVNHPAAISKEPLTFVQQDFLRKQARKIWAYFETFVNAAGNWLPPDHYQEHPKKVLKDYTSPTNIGLSLLANLAAHDFGYLTTNCLVEYTANTLNTMESLERYKGHFYNWYNIHTLKPSPPRYVSTVDSGNLAGHLMTLRQGFDDMERVPVIRPEHFKGLLDTAGILADGTAVSPLLKDFQSVVENIISKNNFTPWQLKEDIIQCRASIVKIMEDINGAADSDTSFWYCALEKQCTDIASSLHALYPWLWLPGIPESYVALLPLRILSLRELLAWKQEVWPRIKAMQEDGGAAEVDVLLDSIAMAGEVAEDLLQTSRRIRQQCTAFADMEYDFLYNKTNMLLAIGFQVETGSLDPDYYDELASEARLASYAAICQGKIPLQSWFALGRPLVHTDESLVMLSANGTMFEYLMPLLVMPDFDNTLLHQACKAAVQTQIAYGRKKNVPWGFSESEYYSLDAASNYQYKVFGAPDLSLRHGFSEEDKVVAPYAAAMALMVSPVEACRNLELLAAQGFSGRYGFYEAIDYTDSRISTGQQHAIVRSYMVHHQGMAFLSMAYLLLDQPMQKRFMTDPELESSILLLQERFPNDIPFHLHQVKAGTNATPHDASVEEETAIWNGYPGEAGEPEVQLLSNRRYHMIVSGEGNCYSRWKNAPITGWQENVHSPSGIYSYVYEPAEEQYWPATNQTAGDGTDISKVSFSSGNAVFHSNNNGLYLQTQISVSPEDDIEIRKMSVYNGSGKSRTIEIISYTAPVNHPDYCGVPLPTAADSHAILFGKAEPPEAQQSAMFHFMTMDTGDVLQVAYLTDHSRIMQPGEGIALVPSANGKKSWPAAPSPSLSTVTGICYRVFIRPNETVVANIFFGIGESREICREMLNKIQGKGVADRWIKMMHLHTETTLKQINVTTTDARLFRRMAGAIMFGAAWSWGHPVAREVPVTDPVFLLRIKSAAYSDVILQMIQMHSYWRMNGIIVKLMIWNEDTGCYRHFLQKLIFEIVSNGVSAELLNRHDGGIFIKAVTDITGEDSLLMQDAVAVIHARNWATAPHLPKSNKNVNEKILTT